MKLTATINIIPATLLSLTGFAQLACGGGNDFATETESAENAAEPGDDSEDDNNPANIAPDDNDDGNPEEKDPDISMGGSPPVDLVLAAPSVLTTSIEDGETAVLPDASITVTFSESMDRKSVEEAYESESLPAVEFVWNDEWTVLTIKPSEPLLYSAAWTLEELDPADEYGLSISKAALSVEGEPLSSGLSITFSTARLLGAFVEPSGLVNGSVRSDGFTSTVVYTGDATSSDLEGKAGYYGTMTFDLAPYEAALGVHEAHLYFDRTIYGSSGPEALGEPSLYAIEASEHTWSAVHTYVTEDNLVGPVVSTEGDQYLVTVTDSLMSQITGDGLAQFALAQPIKTDGDSVADAYVYSKLTLGFSYWVE